MQKNTNFLVLVTTILNADIIIIIIKKYILLVYSINSIKQCYHGFCRTIGRVSVMAPAATILISTITSHSQVVGLIPGSGYFCVEFAFPPTVQDMLIR